MKTQKKVLGTVITMAVCIAFSNPVQGQNNWGLGIRLGDPSGITLKKYSANNAFELSVGRTHWWYGPRWYDRRFYDWYEDQKFGYKDFQYVGYRASVPVGVQLHYLFRKGLNDAPGLEWYYGFGGQLRYQTFRYDYRYKWDGSPDWIYADGGRVTDLDLGADGVIGLEYRFKDAPISIFADATLFMEIVDNPFLFWLQGGLGARYNF
jgi:hypothetical protein